ncbi:MAG: ABC transporter ATP-binding protein [Bacteroidales bacterium]|nr:ABC transporter ATP-binding protein [Bacteroidales bacterium]
MLEAKDIHKSFGNLEVLKGIDLTVQRGEVISIVGASGAGKTTLLQIIGTLMRPDKGGIAFDGIDVTKLSDKALAQFRNKHIGFVFQFHNLLPEFNAVENVCMPALIAGRSMEEARRDALPLMETLGVAQRATHRPAELSGGEQQRVAVARALINRPDVVLADEPSGNLDSQHASDLHQLFFDLRKQFNQAFVIVTHNPQLAETADRKITISDGKI